MDFVNRHLPLLKTMFVKYEVSEYLGVCLLHNHNSVRYDEAMLQLHSNDGKYGEILVTSPCWTTSSDYGRSCPWSFAGLLEDGSRSLRPIEFAIDPLVCSDYQRLQGNKNFIAEFTAYITDCSLQRLVGLALVRRAIWSTTNGLIPVEESNIESRSNVIRLVPAIDYMETKLIQTILPMNDDEITAASCIILCLNSSYCIQRSPGHARETSHGRQHRKQYGPY
jgi:hypothetical protein